MARCTSILVLFMVLACTLGGTSMAQTEAPAPADPVITRKIDVLAAIWSDVEANPLGSEPRKKFLSEFMIKSEWIKNPPADDARIRGLWTLRALAALELDRKRDAWAAGCMMLELGLDREGNEIARKALAALDRAELLDQGQLARLYQSQWNELQATRSGAASQDVLATERRLAALIKSAPDFEEAVQYLREVKAKADEAREMARRKAEQERLEAEQAKARAAQERLDNLWKQATDNDNREGADKAAAALRKILSSNGDERAWRMLLKVGNYHPRRTITNSIGMKLIELKPGAYPMADAGEPDNKLGEVRVFGGPYMGETEVTQAQWVAVMGDNPSANKGEDSSLPVDSVSWNDAVEFCKKLSQKEGRRYRLPSEAEWEYACRAGTLTHYSSGDTEDDLGKVGWYEKNSGNWLGKNKKSRPVAKKKPNAWGIYDMHGNVREWCSDDYVSEGKVNGKVIRGGSWFHLALDCRSSIRGWTQPDHPIPLDGFRVILDLSE